MHSIIETISENIFLKKGVVGLKFYLENFVDIDERGGKFSEVADKLNDWRNIVAHQYISKFGHSFGYNYTIPVGYQLMKEEIIINPKQYFDQFNSAFKTKHGKTKRSVWNYREILTLKEMEQAKTAFLEKFMNR